jgi:hypothetical protein
VSTRRRISSASSTVFSPGARRSHSACPKYEWLAPGGDDQGVEPDLAVREEHLLPRDVDRARLGEEHGRVLLSPQDPPDRRGDVRGGELGGGDLIEEGLEEVVVLPVEERDADRRATERARGVETAETAAEDDDVGEDGRAGHGRASTLSRSPFPRSNCNRGPSGRSFGWNGRYPCEPS